MLRTISFVSSLVLLLLLNQILRGDEHLRKFTKFWKSVSPVFVPSQEAAILPLPLAWIWHRSCSGLTSWPIPAYLLTIGCYLSLSDCDVIFSREQAARWKPSEMDNNRFILLIHSYSTYVILTVLLEHITMNKLFVLTTPLKIPPKCFHKMDLSVVILKLLQVFNVRKTNWLNCLWLQGCSIRRTQWAGLNEEAWLCLIVGLPSTVFSFWGSRA